jgi:tRNA A-37 threonylcarbamoyl transferase component Bud32
MTLNFDTSLIAEEYDILKFLIIYHINKINYYEFKKIIDLSIYLQKNNELELIKNKINSKNTPKEYYLTKINDLKLLKIPYKFCNNKIINLKNNHLFNFYNRNKYNNFKILYFFLKNFKIFNKLILFFNNDSSKLNINYKNIENKYNKIDYIENLLSIDDARNLKENLNFNNNNNNIKYYNINNNIKYKIEKYININIDNIIIKKNFSFDKYDNIEINNIIKYYGGKEKIMEKEIECLKLLFGCKHFPYLLCVDYENFNIYINYCGEQINDKIPDDWKDQINQIINTLKDKNIFHNDIWYNNILIHNNILNVIDFGFSSFIKDDFPFTNLNKNDLQLSNSLIELLDNCMNNSIEKRLLFLDKL